MSLLRDAARITPKPIRRVLKPLVRRLNDDWLMWHGHRSYSQEGEDILLNNHFYWQRRGFYVDVGAFHPTVLSNTYLFYRRGWKGISIEPRPGAKRIFDRKRPRDINLEVAVATQHGHVDMRLYENGLFNRAGPSTITPANPLREIVPVPCLPLAAILNEHCCNAIDFMSVDVEGGELDVLRSNDWERFRPKILCIEILDTEIADVPKTDVGQYLAALGYSYFAKTGFSSFFRDARSFG